MASVPGEIADALVTALQSPAVQSALESAISSGEVSLQAAIDTVISGATASGALGIVVAASKGTVESEVNAEFAKLTPAVIAAWLTSLAVDEAKKLGG